VGASSVHGVCGAWGILSLGLFADGRYGDGWNGVPGKVRGLLYGDGKQFIAECIGIVACVLWVGPSRSWRCGSPTRWSATASRARGAGGAGRAGDGIEGYTTEPLPEGDAP
jgi:hypothetical protein